MCADFRPGPGGLPDSAPGGHLHSQEVPQLLLPRGHVGEEVHGVHEAAGLLQDCVRQEGQQKQIG